MIRRISIKIIGQVQGVFYRANAQKKARLLKLKGYAVNSEDGSVEIIAEGEEKDLRNFLDWAKVGSPLAKVEKVESFWQDPAGEFEDFSIS